MSGPIEPDTPPVRGYAVAHLRSVHRGPEITRYLEHVATDALT